LDDTINFPYPISTWPNTWPYLLAFISITRLMCHVLTWLWSHNQHNTLCSYISHKCIQANDIICILKSSCLYISWNIEIRLRELLPQFTLAFIHHSNPKCMHAWLLSIYLMLPDQLVLFRSSQAPFTNLLIKISTILICLHVDGYHKKKYRHAKIIFSRYTIHHCFYSNVITSLFHCACGHA